MPTLRIHVQKALTGDSVGEILVKDVALVADLRQQIRTQMVKRRRLTRKTKIDTSPFIKLVLKGHVLKDELARISSVLNAGDVVQATLCPPVEVRRCHFTSQLDLKLSEWIRAFLEEDGVETLGCQRLETLAGDAFPDRMEPRSRFLKFVQIQSASAGHKLPPPSYPSVCDEPLKDTPVLLKDMKPGSKAPEKVQYWWWYVAQSVLSGRACPLDISVISLYRERRLNCADRSDFGDLISLAKCSKSGGFTLVHVAGDPVGLGTFSVCGGVSRDQIRQLFFSGESLLQRNEIFGVVVRMYGTDSWNITGDWKEAWDIAPWIEKD